MIAKTNKGQVYLIEILFTFCIYIASQEFSYKNMLEQDTLVTTARLTVYLLLIKNTEPLIQSIHNSIKTKNVVKLLNSPLKYKKLLILFVISSITLWKLDGKMLRGDFLLFAITYLFIKYLEMEEKPNTISYGTGMACSFFEGYLINIIPPDGTQDNSGFLGKISQFEANNNNIIFPVRKLFLIISKGLHCPTDLKGFNRENTYPYLEACKSLEDVQKDVAGVKSRIYRNSVYKIHRGPGLGPVYLAAECATPLHTLYKVEQHKSLYEELIQADYEEIREDFCAMLQSILDKSPECRGKCELMHYDHDNPSDNLAEILLRRIAELEPNFDKIKRITP